MRALICAAALALAACSPPLSVRGDEALVVTENLGAPSTPLQSGVFRVADNDSDIFHGEDGVLQGVVSGTNRPLFADHFLAQLHPASQSYATSYGNMRFYAFDGEHVVLELFSEDDDAIYLPARVDDDGAGLTVLFYNCDAIPQNYRAAQAIEDNCRVSDAAVLLRAMGLLDLGTLDAMVFEWTGPLPARQ